MFYLYANLPDSISCKGALKFEHAIANPDSLLPRGDLVRFPLLEFAQEMKSYTN